MLRSVVNKLSLKCLRVIWVEVTSQLLKSSLKIFGGSEERLRSGMVSLGACLCWKKKKKQKITMCSLPLLLLVVLFSFNCVENGYIFQGEKRDCFEGTKLFLPPQLPLLPLATPPRFYVEKFPSSLSAPTWLQEP